MVDAPASPIATQETVEEIAREKVAAWMIAHSIATGHGDTLDDLLGELSVALSSAERRNEELVNAAERHRDMLKQLLDEANAQHFDATMRADAAEATIESLTGTVGELRTLLDWIASRLATDGFEHLAQTVRNETRRALSGREDDAPLATTPAPTLDGAERR